MTTERAQCGCATWELDGGRRVASWCKKHPYGQGSPLLAKAVAMATGEAEWGFGQGRGIGHRQDPGRRMSIGA